MSQILYAVINPVVRFVLSSRLHGLMSRNTLLLEFKGRKSGKTYTTPVSYHETNGQLHCFTDKANKWWLNLQGGDVVGVTLRGRKLIGRPTVLAPERGVYAPFEAWVSYQYLAVVQKTPLEFTIRHDRVW